MDSQKNMGLLTIEKLFFIGRKCLNFSVINPNLKLKATCTNCKLLLLGACNPSHQYICLQNKKLMMNVDKTVKLTRFSDKDSIQLANYCDKFQIFDEKIIRKCSNCSLALYGECNPSKHLKKMKSRIASKSSIKRKECKKGTSSFVSFFEKSYKKETLPRAGLPVMSGRVRLWTGR